MNKVCSNCGVNKQLDDFSKDNKKKDGHRSQCKKCSSIKAVNKYAADPELRKKACQQAKKNRKPFSDWPDEKKVRLKEYKKIGRLTARPGFKPVKFDAHVKQWAKIRKQNSHAHAKPRTRMSNEEKIQRRKNRDNDNVKLIKNKYVKHLIVKSVPALKNAKIPQSLIDLERARLLIVREIALRKERHEELQ